MKGKIEDLISSELMKEYEVRIRVIGNLDLLPADVRETAEYVMEMTENNKG